MPTVEKIDSEISTIEKKSSNMNKTPSFDNLAVEQEVENEKDIDLSSAMIRPLKDSEEVKAQKNAMLERMRQNLQEKVNQENDK